jgi:hypothetical protein
MQDVAVPTQYLASNRLSACPASLHPANSGAMLQTSLQTSTAALKEWAVTCRALQEGRQVLLLRKGGIEDDYGVFALEHQTFWLQPTYEHQSEDRVKPQERDLFGTVASSQQDGENLDFIALSLWAQVARVWALPPDAEDNLSKLLRAPHIYEESYLRLRLDYKPAHPLLCVALRVFQAEAPHIVTMRPEFLGCRSWIELPEGLPLGGKPALEEAAFQEHLDMLETALR